ncbi:MAG TPA: type II toxin-antitoxin system CcdA family antitoxin [Caulobacteraceae bacterium]|nr:type II toxin-antitoxin system CcdA family antitoxin [Caulobacteraceae bacterium]
MGKTELKIEIDTHMLEQARAREIRLNLVLERALKKELGAAAAEERARRWADENADAIASHNRFVEENGEFGKEWRSW